MNERSVGAVKSGRGDRVSLCCREHNFFGFEVHPGWTHVGLTQFSGSSKVYFIHCSYKITLVSMLLFRPYLSFGPHSNFLTVAIKFH
jgi:hypothetical protein